MLWSAADSDDSVHTICAWASAGQLPSHRPSLERRRSSARLHVRIIHPSPKRWDAPPCSGSQKAVAAGIAISHINGNYLGTFQARFGESGALPCEEERLTADSAVASLGFTVYGRGLGNRWMTSALSDLACHCFSNGKEGLAVRRCQSGTMNIRGHRLAQGVLGDSYSRCRRQHAGRYISQCNTRCAVLVRDHVIRTQRCLVPVSK